RPPPPPHSLARVRRTNQSLSPHEFHCSLLPSAPFLLPAPPPHPCHPWPRIPRKLLLPAQPRSARPAASLHQHSLRAAAAEGAAFDPSLFISLVVVWRHGHGGRRGLRPRGAVQGPAPGHPAGGPGRRRQG
uniref:Uncharacterized protein n=1 Tax=Aegilops tauschii subsp. strangulata TaxID=200361 RepID=A0A453L4F2_AEGTS